MNLFCILRRFTVGKTIPVISWWYKLNHLFFEIYCFCKEILFYHYYYYKVNKGTYLKYSMFKLYIAIKKEKKFETKNNNTEFHLVKPDGILNSSIQHIFFCHWKQGMFLFKFTQIWMEFWINKIILIMLCLC